MAKRTIRMTKAAVAALPNATGAHEYYADADTPGLWLRVTAAGRRVFLYQRKIAGRKVRVTIGPFPAVTPDQARREVLEMQAVAARGDDPGAKRRDAADGQTFGDLFGRYLTEYAAVRHKDGGAEARRKGEVYLGTLLGRRWSDVGTPFLRQLQDRLRREHGPVLSNRTLEMVRGVWNWGIRQEEPSVPPSNRAALLTPYPEAERERFLSGEELRALFEALDAESPPWREYFMLALLTGARRGNVSSMRWRDMDMAAGTWTVPAVESKNGRAMQVVLVPAAVATLERLRGEQEAARLATPYVFPSASRSGHLSYPHDAWRRVCGAAGLVGVTIHDLRRTMGSWQAATGASLPIIGRSLGHKSTAATAIYARLDLDPVRAAVERAAEAMLAAARVKA